ncbi:hypothetical protein C7475_110182 [Chitinophaga sp. S165]|nr:hypothetical protein C7475_110182 [Chitinophaga sp. S165]
MPGLEINIYRHPERLIGKAGRRKRQNVYRISPDIWLKSFGNLDIEGQWN